MRILVLTNPHSGPRGSNEQIVREAFAACADHEVELRVLPPDRICTEAKKGVEERFDCIVAAGGDGTVNAVASALVGSDVALGVLPIGTLNHFAKDVGIPLVPSDAARSICAGTVRRIDVAQVNGRLFVNNSSIGIYPHMVKRREGEIQRLGRGKWFATLLATIVALRRFPTVHVRVQADGTVWECSTPFVMIGNNPYTFDLFNFASRPRCDAGQLGVYFARHTGRFGLLRLVILGWMRRLNQARDFTQVTCRELWIESRKRELRVATDGEIHKLRTPLHYVSRPGALRVMG